MIALSLPYPPSANRLWRAVPGKGVMKSAEYRAWCATALAWVQSQGSPHLTGRYCMSLEAQAPDRRKRDLGNLLKATEDALRDCGVIDDDSLARRIILAWSDKEPAKPGALHITLRGAE